MSQDFTSQYGKPICVGMYVLFAALAARKRPLPLLIMLALHYGEYVFVGKRVAEQNGYSERAGLFQCLCFGFTWWLPLKKG